MYKLEKAELMREVKDYIYITLGLISYSLGWAAFLLPYQITTGGTTGIGAIIYYATRISDPMVIFYYQCSSDDICHPYARSPIQYKNYVRHLYADIPALAFPINSQQLYSGTGYDTGRQTVIAWTRTRFHGLYYRSSHVRCGLGHHFQL